MESRVVLDALSPPLASFASLTQASNPSSSSSSSSSSFSTLRSSLRNHFQPPPNLPSSPSIANSIIRPRDLPALQRIILNARRHNRPLRPCVPRQPLSPTHHLFLTNGGLLIDMSLLSSVVINSKRALVIVQAGCLIHHLSAAVKHVGGVAVGGEGCVGGAIVGGKEGVLVDGIVQMTLVDAEGRLRVIAEGTDEMKAIKGSLGSFGVIYDVTLRIDIARRLAKVTSEFISMDALMGDAVRKVRTKVNARADVELTWVPFNSWPRWRASWTPEEDVAWMRTLHRVTQKSDAVELDEDHDVVFRFRTLPQWLSLNEFALRALGYTEFHPSDVRVYLGAGFMHTAWKLEGKPYIQTTAHAQRYQDNPDGQPVVEVGAAFPVRDDDHWEVLQSAWKIVTAKVAECDRKGEYPLNVAMKTRFVRASDGLLAANYCGRGRRNSVSAIVRIISAKNTHGWSDFARDVIGQWMRLPNARCILTRELAQICSTEAIASNLGETLQKFKAIRRASCVDTAGMFLDGDIFHLLGFHEEYTPLDGSPISSPPSAGHLLRRSTEVESLFQGQAESKGSTNIDTIYDKMVPSDECANGGLNEKRPRRITLEQTSETSGISSSTDIDEEGYEGDNDGWSEDVDDVSVGSGDTATKDVPEEQRRGVGEQQWRGARRRKVMAKSSPRQAEARAASRERTPLWTYICLYALLWIALFGPQALQRLMWKATV